MQIIDGKKLAAEIRAKVKETIAAEHRSPGLGVVLMGTDPASHTYVRLKEKACAEVGIRFERTLLPAAASQTDVLDAVAAFNAREDIDAVLVQLPLPGGIDENLVVRTMDPAKDVDGFHPENLKLLMAGTPRIMPVIIKGMLALVESTGTSLPDRRVVVFANSEVFSAPLRRVLEDRGCTVTVLSGDDLKNPALSEAEIVIAALGRPHALRAVDCKDGAVIIDVGTNQLPDGTYVGDVDPTGSETKPGWITPVPGGVGPMTVAMLTENVLELNRARHR